jgi:hypothetical protein
MEDLPKSLAQHVFIRHPPNSRGFKPNLRPFQAPGKLGPPTEPPPARRLTATLNATSIGFPFEIEDCWRGMQPRSRKIGVSTLSGACVLCVLVRHLMG